MRLLWRGLEVQLDWVGESFGQKNAAEYAADLASLLITEGGTNQESCLREVIR